jgi:hypothetical protein
MKLKLDANGNVVLQDGKPVYVYEDGKEIAFDAPQAMAKIGQLNGESKTNRERAEDAEKRLKAYEGIEDPVAALKALNTIKNLDDKKLVDAGEVEKVKTEAIKAVEEKYAPVVKQNEQLVSQLRAEKIGGSFARSKFIADKLNIPSDVTEAFFGKHFSVEEDGSVIAVDSKGNKIFSRVRPGEIADFDEALESLVESYPNRDHIMKSSGASGAGAHGGEKGGKTGSTKGNLGGSQEERMNAITDRFKTFQQTHTS